MPWRKNNPYAPHTFHHFSWNVYHLLVYQFGRYAVFAWVALTAAVAISLLRIEHVIMQNQRLIQQNHVQINAINTFRLERKKQTAETDASLCVRTHKLVTIMGLFLTEGGKQFQLRPTTKSGSQEINRFSVRVKKLLREADCNPNVLPSRK